MTDLVVTVDNVDLDLIGNLERICFDEILPNAEAVVPRDGGDVTDLVVTMDNVDFDLIGNLERIAVCKACFDEILPNAETVVPRDGRDRSHG